MPGRTWNNWLEQREVYKRVAQYASTTDSPDGLPSVRQMHGGDIAARSAQTGRDRGVGMVVPLLG
jgi:hypothetical protein